MYARAVVRAAEKKQPGGGLIKSRFQRSNKLALFFPRSLVLHQRRRLDPIDQGVTCYPLACCLNCIEGSQTREADPKLGSTH